MNKFKTLIFIVIMVLLLTIVCACNKTKAKFTFDVDGGVPIESVQLKKGEQYTLTTPVKNGYEFEGWYTNKEGMTSVAIFSKQSGLEFFRNKFRREPSEYKITYLVEGAGVLIGETTQFVKEGQNAAPVLAIANEEWAFVGWSDYVENPYRFDTEVNKDITIYAIFIEVIDEDEEAEYDEMEEGDEPRPGLMPGQETGEDGFPIGNEEHPGTQESGIYEDNNQVIDGETYYGGTVYEEAYEHTGERMEQDEDLEEDKKDVIEEYFKTIKK